jgi:arylsulfatase A-like enzyme
MPWLVFWVLFLLPDAARIWRNRLVWSLIAAIAMVQLWPAGGQRRVLAVELQSHPVLFMISDIVRGVRTDNQRHTVEISPYSKGASPALRSDQAALNRADPHREQQPTVSSDVDRGQPLPRPSERDVTARLAPVAPTKSRSLERSDVSPPLGIVPQEPEAPLLPHPAMISPHGALTINPTGEAITRQIEPLPKRVSELQSRSLRLIEPYWIDPLTPPKYQLPPQQSWNVLLVVLESTGFQYIFDRSRGIRPPMPFLEKLSKQGWWLKRHFSPSNSSARSLFSIMSSIYPRPQLRMFSMQKDASVPSLASFLRRTHDSFLVIPSPLTWFFPQWFLRHSGLDEIYGYHNLPVRKQSPGGAYAKDERESMNFFIQRIKRATQPFFATYFSFIPHWPYPDYGPDTHVFPNNRSILRYYNNLALLDQLLEQLFEQLQSSGMMERTIVVITGDHGEAFGQHPGNWTHSRQSFNENFQVPALFYQPKLFSPRVIDWFTNHVDIVPTLLDTMRIPYDERLLQGESLWQHRLRRKYMFLYGNENTLTSISRDHIKLQYSFKHRYCWVYNLKNDPDERKRLGCKDHLEQMRATLLYHQHQIAILERYNRVWQSKPDFFGAKHPNLGSVSP